MNGGTYSFFLQPITSGWEPREGGQSEELVTEPGSGCESKITDTHTILILIMILGQRCMTSVKGVAASTPGQCSLIWTLKFWLALCIP